ncbi:MULTISPECIES: helix-turn-helix transcriptional regulator [Acinetobacter]|nr:MULTISPECIES: AlpA family phage regulatory protein [Acinetobacter]AVZ86391.1 AlpA family phage regulatory protein [Acinetobacter sp. WCHA45]MCE6119514.1 AlpA family phage regulatory protein [Acinetobacter baumannii]MCE6138091.1 AlpA family phage regulatory protein [Acinetobacter baumannii]MCG9241657.1 AlpA family phage regulatory protein [Acinetobacter baumannii]MCH7378957.1 AlpA family phage regulatory protein [Acinetobacter higginsii]
MLKQQYLREEQPSTERFYRMSDLANIPERPARIHQYKSGINKGKTRVIGERQASKGLIGVSEKTLWEWVRKGEFPQPIKLSPTITVWRATDIAEWMKSKEMECSK